MCLTTGRRPKLLLASSNPRKLCEYRALAPASTIELELISGFSQIPAFDESAPTFAENAAGKAIHYSRHAEDFVFADDSGLVVPALGGAPGVHSARHAGAEASDADRVSKLLAEMQGRHGQERRAKFICVIALARKGEAVAVISDSVEGILSDAARGAGGFGYDPVFFIPVLAKTFAELSLDEKNRLSHRARSFRKLLEFLESFAL